MKLQASLSQRSINHLIGEVKKYRLSLPIKTEVFVRKLLDEGIKVAYAHVPGRYSGYVEFTKDGYSNSRQTVGILVGSDSKTFISKWVLKDGTEREAKVSGLLMSEFGSGWLADVRWNVTGVGQGTFPEQTHATDPDGWYWTDLDGTRHHSIGEAPTYPMYYADMAMLSKIDTIAREVFNGI